LLIVVALLTVYAIVIAAAYVFAFGFEVSSNQATWGQFGDFVGGTINPIAAVVTVWLLWRTYQTQRKELEEARKLLLAQNAHLSTQARLSDTERALEEAFRVWKSLSEPSFVGPYGARQQTDPTTGQTSDYLVEGNQSSEGGAIRRLDVLTHPERRPELMRVLAASQDNNPMAQLVTSRWVANFAGMPYILAEIAHYLDDYDRLMQDNESKQLEKSALTEFYRQRLSDAAATLRDLRCLNSDVAGRLSRRVDHHRPISTTES
jgi:hypothetical protein